MRRELLVGGLILAAFAGGIGIGVWGGTNAARADCAAQPPRCVRFESATVTVSIETDLLPDLGTEPKVKRQPASAVAAVEKEGP